MNTLAIESPPRAVQVACSEAELTVDLSDGRRIAALLAGSPSVEHSHNVGQSNG